ncbi:hypothetical protein Bca52824_047083 [Brassica carinata]|uniref:Uncharacterized protein n=1 Tax=Brassica carinata TaxID=52824 RepID=A0A8X7RE53_BRACI|nr:hypothetical protein Bca52824_047083 [Brassica carinata]
MKLLCSDAVPLQISITLNNACVTLVAVQTPAEVRLKVLGGKECQERRRADGVDMLLLDKKALRCKEVMVTCLLRFWVARDLKKSGKLIWF